MHTVYTTTITDEARRRGITIEVLDEATPVFVLQHGANRVRCYNSLTDRVGAVTFHLTQDKHLANSFLRRHGFPVPDQELFTSLKQADAFLARHATIVVKPCTQWGARGVSVRVTTPADLHTAVRKARRYEESVLIEAYTPGVDKRLIYIDYRFVAAIQRNPATVIGTGADTIRTLITKKNRQARRIDPSNRVPFDRETEKALAVLGFTYDSVPEQNAAVEVRLTSNYHTGGTVDVITDRVEPTLVSMGHDIARATELPVLGVDFLVEPGNGVARVIELAPDLAISPPEGAEVAKRFLDYLFPETKVGESG